MTAIQELQDKLVSPNILVLPYAKDHHALDTDVCSVQVECALLQKQTYGITRQVGCWSRPLTKANKAYDTAQREWFAMV